MKTYYVTVRYTVEQELFLDVEQFEDIQDKAEDHLHFEYGHAVYDVKVKSWSEI